MDFFHDNIIYTTLGDHFHNNFTTLITPTCLGEVTICLPNRILDREAQLYHDWLQKVGWDQMAKVNGFFRPQAQTFLMNAIGDFGTLCTKLQNSAIEAVVECLVQELQKRAARIYAENLIKGLTGTT